MSLNSLRVLIDRNKSLLVRMSSVSELISERSLPASNGAARTRLLQRR